MKPQYQAVRGTRDLLPDEIDRWLFVEATAREVFSRYGFREIRTPLLEPTELFVRSVGESTDIVRKEMYTIERGDESVTLRPENTAPVVRAFVEHSLHRGVASGYPERYFYIGPMFRYERPQKGRQRQFHQAGVEVLGAPEPLCDAETMEMLWTFLDELGIRDRELVLNSVGDAACRTAFREALLGWLGPRLASLCEDCRRRYAENPLRVFDCKIEEDRALLADAPLVLDHLCAPCSDHFAAVRHRLDGYRIPYRVDPRMVRGLDYYQRTVFEVTSSRLGAQNSILGGGRYDGLVAELGGPAVSGFGFAVGLERLVLLLPEERAPRAEVDLWVVALGAHGWGAAIPLVRRLRAAGLRVVMPLAERPMGAQLKRAERSRARFALFVGDAEIASGSYGLKDLATGEQTTVDEEGILARAGERNGR
jgi:histidyl-tRNA synthetase